MALPWARHVCGRTPRARYCCLTRCRRPLHEQDPGQACHETRSKFLLRTTPGFGASYILWLIVCVFHLRLKSGPNHIATLKGPTSGVYPPCFGKQAPNRHESPVTPDRPSSRRLAENVRATVATEVRVGEFPTEE